MKTVGLKRVVRVAVGALLVLLAVACGPADGNAGLLDELDAAIAERAAVHERREATMAVLRAEIDSARTVEERFHAMGHLLDEYMSYNTDSALAISRRRIDLANATGNPELRIHAALSQAHVLSIMCMYKEALDQLGAVARDSLPEYLIPYFYHINRTIYGFMADYASDDAERARYSTLVDVYRDSSMVMNVPGSFYYVLAQSDGLNAHGKAVQAAEALEGYLAANDISDHEKALAAYTLSESYRMLGDKDKEKRELIVSSINDMRTGVNEYVSLRKLALLLYQEGDVQHAYDYLNICLKDAQECNARLRILEINNVFPIVNEVYLDTIAMQQSRLRLALVLVGLMALVLLATVYYIYREKKKVELARQSVAEMNSRLVDANNAIHENSCLKEEFIAQYMDQCTLYIDKIDKYQKAMSKVAATKQVDELKKMLKTLPTSDVEAKAFYDNFDVTFLKLFPTFVRDFNALLRPDEALVPKAAGRLNTELRIFALIRLGITDSVRIAQFLRYSTATIYNYRTRVRNKAAGDREKLETELMKIGNFA